MILVMSLVMQLGVKLHMLAQLVGRKDVPSAFSISHNSSI
jgi:hypothetical protein